MTTRTSFPDTSVDSTPPSEKIRDLIVRERHAREDVAEMYHRTEKAAVRAEKASAISETFGWKMNALLVLATSTMALVAALVAWTVSRVDRIEGKVQDVSLLVAKFEARLK